MALKKMPYVVSGVSDYITIKKKHQQGDKEVAPVV
jgi:hypothetical protein